MTLDFECSAFAFLFPFLRVMAAFTVLARVRAHLGIPVLASIAASFAILCFLRDGGSLTAACAVAPSKIDAQRYGGLLLLNLTYGLLAGLPYAILLEALPMAARLLDTVRGAQAAEQMLPGVEARTSPLETVAGLGAVNLFFAGGLYQPFVKSLLHGLPYARPAAFPAFHEDAVVLFGARSIERAVLLAAPAAAGLLILELALGILGRLGHRFPLASELTGAKLLLGTALALLLTREVLPSWLTASLQAFRPGLESLDNR